MKFGILNASARTMLHEMGIGLKDLSEALDDYRRSKANKRNNYSKAFGKCRQVVDPAKPRKKRPHTRGYIH